MQRSNKCAGLISAFSRSIKAFTLVELLVVVVIVMVLVAVAVPQYKKVVLLSRAAEAKLIVSEFEREVELYLLTNGWPSGTVMFSGRWNSKKINFMEGHTWGQVESYGRKGEFSFWAQCSASNCYLTLIYCPHFKGGNPGYSDACSAPIFQLKTTRTPSSTTWQHECSRASVSSFCQSIRSSGW